MDAAAEIIVCAHDSPDDVRRCLDTSLASLGPADHVIVVDDGSAEETRRLCEARSEAHPGQMSLLRHTESLGFCRAANAGIRASSAPLVVLLNSDAVVPLGWLDRIRACLETHPAIGIAGPLSNAGGWQSIPEIKTGGPPNNQVASDDKTLAAIQSFCERFPDLYDYPIIEQVNGFCLAIRRAVFDRIGYLDETHFPRGYGEEIDFCLRAQDAGFLCAAATDCFVYHAKTKSYTVDARTRLIAEGRAHLDIIHGAARVRAAVNGCKTHPILKAIRAHARPVFADRGWLLPADP